MSANASQSHAADVDIAHAPPAQTAALSSPVPHLIPSKPVTGHTTNSLPTPASSVCGRATNPSSMEEGDGSPQITSNPTGASMDNGQPTDTMHSDALEKQRHTNHDRQSVASQQSSIDGRIPSSFNNASPFTPEFGKRFHLCKTNPPPVTGPSMRLDLVSLYGLESVAASVARNDLVTGVKLNRLRKHYEGKIKPLGLSGKNKPVRHEPGAPGGLLDLTAWPEDEWQNQKVSGKEIKIAEPETTQHKMLMRAMRMEPGPLPDNAYWDDLLAPEKPGKTGDSFRRSASVPDRGVSQRPNSLSAAPSPQPDYATSRPRRSGKKRSYHDSSFAGYGEGFFDDDGDAGSAQDDDWKGGKKKRRKDQATPPPYPPAERGGSYGVGMFGLGAR